MNSSLQIPLDLPNVRLLSSSHDAQGNFILEVESSHSFTKCRCCGHKITEFHGYDRPIRLRHLPILGRDVWIEIRPKRYRCRHCEGDPTTTQTLEWYDPRSPHTRAFEDWLLKMLGNSTVMDVSRRCGVSYGEVEGVLKRRVSTQVDWSGFKQLRTLGIDEIALKKGHKHYAAIISSLDDHDRPQVLAVLPDRLKETVAAFLRSIPEHLQTTVCRACCDMNEGFANAVRETLPKVAIVIDRFHVAQYYNREVDNFRKQTLQELKQTLSADTYATCKGTLWLFRHHYWSLTAEQRGQLEEFLLLAPELKDAWLLRHELNLLFEQEQTKAQAQQQLQDWKAKVKAAGLACFDKFLNLLETWQDGITNYFEDRNTSGFVEGMNNKLKVIKRRCYGLLDVKRFFQHIQVDLAFSRKQPA